MGPVDLRRLRQREGTSLETVTGIPEAKVLIPGLPVARFVTLGPQFPHL